MIIWLLIGVLALIFFLGGTKWLSEADPKAVKRILALVGAIVLAGVAIALIFTGRFFIAGPIALAAYTAYRRYRQAKGWWDMASSLGKRMGRGGAGDQTASSSIETAYVKMSLDHANTGLDGTVLQGVFQGRALSGLTLPDLLGLLDILYREDTEGARLLEAFLDRYHGDWRADRGQGTPDAAGGPMTAKEAVQILALKEGASDKEVRAAHHKLMLKLHPDQGGSTYLAAKINEAKDILLKKQEK